jgi:O-antigen biosynthesis protein
MMSLADPRGTRSARFDGPAKAVLKLANAARDRRDWATAASAYRQYLNDRPNHFAAWVQLGHALKESGQSSAALVAYGEALGLNENDADLLLNIGHLMKVMGFADDAVSYYQRSADSDGNAHATSELRHLGAAPRA